MITAQVQRGLRALAAFVRRPPPAPLPPVPLLDGEAVRVLFVAQHPAIWPSWRSVWSAMQGDPRFSPRLVVAPFFHALASESHTLRELCDRLVEENVPFCPANAFDLAGVQPHVVFLQNPYDHTRPAEWRTDALAARGSRLAYVPYGLEVSGGAWNVRAQFDLPLHRRAWRIFARSERHRALFARYCRAGTAHVVVTGHPKFDSARAASAEALPPIVRDKVRGRRTILWTPHFTVGNPPQWSTWLRYADVIFDACARRPELFLLIRPHPLFFRAMLEQARWSPDEERAFRLRIAESDNAALDESADCHAAFAASNALMTDAGSFLLEYLPYRRPLLYLHHPEGLGLNDEAHLTQAMEVASRPEDVSAFIARVARGEDAMQAVREARTPALLAGLNANIGAEIAEHVHASLVSGDRGPAQRVVEWRPADGLDRYSRRPILRPLRAAGAMSQLRQAVAEAVQRLGPAARIAELAAHGTSCADALATGARAVVAFDVTPARHTRHRKTTEAVQGRVTRKVAPWDEVTPLERFAIVTLIEVVATIGDDFTLMHFLTRMQHLAREEAHVVLVDTLSTSSRAMLVRQGRALTRHRPLVEYRGLLERQGWTLEDERVVGALAEHGLVRQLSVYRPPTSITHHTGPDGQAA